MGRWLVVRSHSFQLTEGADTSAQRRGLDWFTSRFYAFLPTGNKAFASAFVLNRMVC